MVYTTGVKNDSKYLSHCIKRNSNLINVFIYTCIKLLGCIIHQREQQYTQYEPNLGIGSKVWKLQCPHSHIPKFLIKWQTHAK